MFFVMAYYKNGDLMQYSKKKGGLTQIPIETRLKWMLQLLKAVEFMHAAGYTHRDLKLDNAFLDENLNLALGDFGVAKKIEFAL